ncbi:MAG TPA: alpha/beta family hydrolase [Blastocatellia bacterium]|nr:alpha/beta family hydrolase [Blastocatellia bacterium]
MIKSIEVNIGADANVSAKIYEAASGHSEPNTIILGHGAGAAQTSDFMVQFAQGLASRGLNAVTFNFLYTERGRHVPDPGPKLESCYRSVISAIRATEVFGSGKLVIGGKSMGGRIASQVAAAGVDGVSGLVFLGYPLHPPGKPDKLRDSHLYRIKQPMLFVQGSRDSFGSPDELSPVLKQTIAPHELYVIENGDHSFKVPKKGAVTQAGVYSAVMDRIAEWVAGIAS